MALRRSCLRQGALDAGEADLTEDSGVVNLLYDSCGCVGRFDVRRWEFGKCGTRGGTYNIEKNYLLGIAGQIEAPTGTSEEGRGPSFGGCGPFIFLRWGISGEQ